MTPNELSAPRRSFLKGALATPVVAAGASLLAPSSVHAQGATHGPSTSVEPYLAPSIAGAKLVSILTVLRKSSCGTRRAVAT